MSPAPWQTEEEMKCWMTWCKSEYWIKFEICSVVSIVSNYHPRQVLIENQSQTSNGRTRKAHGITQFSNRILWWKHWLLISLTNFFQLFGFWPLRGHSGWNSELSWMLGCLQLTIYSFPSCHLIWHEAHILPSFGKRWYSTSIALFGLLFPFVSLFAQQEYRDWAECSADNPTKKANTHQALKSGKWFNQTNYICRKWQ